MYSIQFGTMLSVPLSPCLAKLPIQREASLQYLGTQLKLVSRSEILVFTIWLPNLESEALSNDTLV